MQEILIDTSKSVQGMDDLTSSINKTSKATDDLVSSQDKLNNNLADGDKEAVKLAKQEEKITKARLDQNKATKTAITQQDKMNSSLKDAEKSVLSYQSGMAGVVGSVVDFIKVNGGLVGAFNATTAAVKKNTVALLANPFGAIAVAVTTLVGILFKAVKSFTSTSEGAAAMEGALAPLKILVDGITGAFQTLGEGVVWVIDGITDFVGAMTIGTEKTQEQKKAYEEAAFYSAKFEQNLRKVEEAEYALDRAYDTTKEAMLSGEEAVVLMTSTYEKYREVVNQGVEDAKTAYEAQKKIKENALADGKKLSKEEKEAYTETLDEYTQMREKQRATDKTYYDAVLEHYDDLSDATKQRITEMYAEDVARLQQEGGPEALQDAYLKEIQMAKAKGEDEQAVITKYHNLALEEQEKFEDKKQEIYDKSIAAAANYNKVAEQYGSQSSVAYAAKAAMESAQKEWTKISTTSNEIEKGYTNLIFLLDAADAEHTKKTREEAAERNKTRQKEADDAAAARKKLSDQIALENMSDYEKEIELINRELEERLKIAGDDAELKEEIYKQYLIRLKELEEEYGTPESRAAQNEEDLALLNGGITGGVEVETNTGEELLKDGPQSRPKTDENDDELTDEEKLEKFADNATQMGLIYADVLSAAGVSNELFLASLVNLDDAIETLADDSAGMGEKMAAGFQVANVAMQGLGAALDAYYEGQMHKGEVITAAQEKENRATFERQKKLRIAMASIDMAMGIGGVVASSLAEYGFPWGLIPAALGAAMIGTTGGIQIANIKKQPYEGGTAATPAAPSLPSASSANSALEAETPDVDFTDNINDGVLNDKGNESEQLTTKVYVVESEITDTQNKVAAIESESTF